MSTEQQALSGLKWTGSTRLIGQVLSCTRLEIGLLDLARSLRDPVLAGAVMYAAVIAVRPILAGVPHVYRLAALVLVGAAVYLPLVSLLNRAIWADLRRLR